ncbi:hypothetical protein [Streptomyces sp. NPDC051636]|uniref:hypothetical protein n=1 Tax=Streptomyces sp. NPDC051636 TaxID=3365663 RepID=UPI003793BCAE
MELTYPWTQITGQFPVESSVEVKLSITHNGDAVEDAAVVDAVKDAITAAGAISVSATTYSVTSTPV